MTTFKTYRMGTVVHTWSNDIRTGTLIGIEVHQPNLRKITPATITLTFDGMEDVCWKGRWAERFCMHSITIPIRELTKFLLENGEVKEIYNVVDRFDIYAAQYDAHKKRMAKKREVADDDQD